MIVLGLTGSIGMGKSKAAKAFRRLDVPVFDSDHEVHALMTKGGAAVGAVGLAFPGVVIDGAVDRGALGARVFGDAGALRKLEALIHPLVAEARARFLDACREEGAGLVVLDVPLLFEVGGEDDCDYVAVVSAPADVQRRRVLGREGMSEARFEAILREQMPDEEKRRRADFVIWTDQPPDDTFAAISAMVKKLRQKNERRG